MGWKQASPQPSPLKKRWDLEAACQGARNCLSGCRGIVCRNGNFLAPSAFRRCRVHVRLGTLSLGWSSKAEGREAVLAPEKVQGEVAHPTSCLPPA